MEDRRKKENKRLRMIIELLLKKILSIEERLNCLKIKC